jgi:hypothetical protein
LLILLAVDGALLIVGDWLTNARGYGFRSFPVLVSAYSVDIIVTIRSFGKGIIIGIDISLLIGRGKQPTPVGSNGGDVVHLRN